METESNIATTPKPKPITIKVGITPPPNEIYKYRFNRIAPAQEMWGNGTTCYAPKEASYIQGEGIFVHYYGSNIPPSRCVAPVEAIYAINPIKRHLVNTLRLLSKKEMRPSMFALLFIGKKARGRLLTDFITYFNKQSDLTLNPFYLHDGYYCRFSREIRYFVTSIVLSFGVSFEAADRFGEIIACLFEYDNAYRYRPQDIAGETTKEALIKDLPKELDRLIKIEASRETLLVHPELGNISDVTHKFKMAIKVMKILWFIPKYRRALRKALTEMRLENLQMDDLDIYHTYLYSDYNVKGLTIEERIKKLEKIHGPDNGIPSVFPGDKGWPVRMSVNQAEEFRNR